MYSSAVETYSLSSDAVKKSRNKHWRLCAILMVCYVLTSYGLWRWWPSYPRESIDQFGIDVGSQLLFMFVLSLWNMSTFGVTVTISDYEMHGKAFGSRKTVHRGRVRTILYRKSGVVVSEHSRMRTRWVGGVYIPKALPEYDRLKDVAETWKAPEKVS